MFKRLRLRRGMRADSIELIPTVFRYRLNAVDSRALLKWISCGRRASVQFRSRGRSREEASKSRQLDNFRSGRLKHGESNGMRGTSSQVEGWSNSRRESLEHRIAWAEKQLTDSNASYAALAAAPVLQSIRSGGHRSPQCGPPGCPDPNLSPNRQNSRSGIQTVESRFLNSIYCLLCPGQSSNGIELSAAYAENLA